MSRRRWKSRLHLQIMRIQQAIELSLFSTCAPFHNYSLYYSNSNFIALIELTHGIRNSTGDVAN